MKLALMIESAIWGGEEKIPPLYKRRIETQIEIDDEDDPVLPEDDADTDELGS